MKKIYYKISISDKRLSSFFISLILTLSFYSFLLFPLFFVLILSYLSGTFTFFFGRHIWAELSLLFWTFLSGTFFPGGGGAHAPNAPTLRTRLISRFIIVLSDKKIKHLIVYQIKYKKVIVSSLLTFNILPQ